MLCLYEARISGGRLHDHWSSGLLFRWLCRGYQIKQCKLVTGKENVRLKLSAFQ